MSDPRSRRNLDRLLFAGIGLLEGAVWWWADPFHVSDLGTARVALALVFFASSAALVVRFTWSATKPLRAAAFGLALGALVAAIAGWVMAQIPEHAAPYQGDAGRIGTWVIGAFVFLYVAVPFDQVFQESGRLRFSYPRLFDHSWNNFFVGAVALFFVGVFWTVLGVWAGLFKLIGISLFASLFESRAFAYLATFTAFGWGLEIGRASEGVIRTLRWIALLIGRTLLPLLGVIVLLFLATLPFAGLDKLWKTGDATPLLLTLLALLVLSINAVFEDGSGTPPYVSAVRGIIRLAIVVAPALAALAFYGSGLRVAQHGLTPDRVFALLFDLVAAAYAIGYAAAALRRRGSWLAMLPKTNIALAWFVAAVAVLVHTPLLDPLHLSATEQTWRLTSGRSDATRFDYATLRFRLGHAGFEALERLETIHDHPQADVIRRLAKRTLAASDYAEARGASTPPLDVSRFEVIPAGTPVPQGLLHTIACDVSDCDFHACAHAGACLLLGVDLDGDGSLEYCAILDQGWPWSPCYDSDAKGQWSRIGQLEYAGKVPKPCLEEIKSRLKAGPLRTKSPRYRALDLGTGELDVVP